MVVYPISEQQQFDQIMKSFRWTRITLRRFRFNGIDYNQVLTTDMNLLKTIYDAFPINRDEFIKSI